MNGVMMPSVSAGSSQREASVMCTPHVMVPSGAAAAERATPSRRASAKSAMTMRETERLMGSSQPRGEYTAAPERSALDGARGQSLHHVLLEDQHQQDGGERAQEPGR